MKTLLRNYKSESYIWKDATYNANTFFVDDDTTVQYNNIVSIIDDNRPKQVKCSVCGQIFKKGSKEWKEHIRPNSDNSKCWTCRYRKETRDYNKQLDKKYIKMENGNYKVVTTGEYILECANTYPRTKLNEALSTCYYNRCINAKADEYKDFFQTYPGAFDDIITVDKVLEFGYRDRYYNDKYTIYELKARNIIKVYVNQLGIVEYIIIYYNRQSKKVYYSKKYNKIFAEDFRGEYSEANFIGWIPQDSVNLILKKLAALYN